MIETTIETSRIIEPFKTAYDVTPDTPLNDIPKEYYADVKAKYAKQAEDVRALNKGLEELCHNPNIEQFLLAEIHRTVSSKDDHVIKPVFYSGISAYASPLNLALKCESGGGKSYSTTQTIKYMPPENVWYIASQSPKVISHENGKHKTKDGRNVDEIPEPVKPARDNFDNNQDYRDAYQGYLRQWYLLRYLLSLCLLEIRVFLIPGL